MYIMHTHMNIHMHLHRRMYMYMHLHCTYTYTCAHTHMHMHAPAHARTYTYMYMYIYTRHTCTITAKKQNMALWFYALRMWRVYGIEARCPAQHARRFHGFVRYSSRRFMSLLDRMLKTSATVAAKHGRLTKASHLCCTCMA